MQLSLQAISAMITWNGSGVIVSRTNWAGRIPTALQREQRNLLSKLIFILILINPALMLRFTTVRAGNVIGGGDWALNRIVPDCFRAWNKDQAVKIRNPNSTRPWQHVLEPLSGYLRAAQVLVEGNDKYSWGAIQYWSECGPESYCA